MTEALLVMKILFLAMAAKETIKPLLYGCMMLYKFY